MNRLLAGDGIKKITEDSVDRVYEQLDPKYASATQGETEASSSSGTPADSSTSPRGVRSLGAFTSLLLDCRLCPPRV